MDKSKQELIKLSDSHYIVVHGSKIEEGDWVWYNKTIGQLIFTQDDLGQEYELQVGGISYPIYDPLNVVGKITHSTQPLSGKCNECTGYCDQCVEKIKLLSLSEVEEVIYGYSVEKMAEKYANDTFKGLSETQDKQECKEDYIEGFNAHKELVKDKFVLSINQIHKIIAMSKMAKTHDGLIDMDSWIHNGYEGATPAYSEEEIIQSLLPKTEWECYISDGKLILL